MQSTPSEALRVPTGTYQPIVVVDAFLGGKLMAANIPVISGSLAITGGQNIRSRLTMTVADASGLLTPKPGAPLSPWGGELHVKAGVMVGQIPELVSLGWFPIMTATTTEEWVTYYRPQEPDRPYRVSRGLSVAVEAVDRAQIISDARFEDRVQPSHSSVLDEIATLLRGVVPFRVPGGITDHQIPSGTTYDDDRLGTFAKLANVCNCDPIIDPNGIATLLPQAPTTAPVWTIGAGTDGTLVAFSRKLDRDKIYNAVIARTAESTSGLYLQGRAVVTDGPLRYDGPLGRIPYFESLPVVTTQAAINRAAATTLARLTTRRTQSVDITTVPNYALEVGDVITLECPYGFINGEITVITYPLVPGPMTLSIAVDPVNFAGVS